MANEMFACEKHLLRAGVETATEGLPIFDLQYAALPAELSKGVAVADRT